MRRHVSSLAATAVIAIGLLGLTTRPASASNVWSITSFETAADVQRITSNNVDCRQTAVDVTDGTYALQATFAPASAPSFTYPFANPQDLTNTAGAAVDIANVSPLPAALQLTLIDGAGATASQSITLPGGSAASIRFTVLADSAVAHNYGLSALPNPFPAMKTLRASCQQGFMASNIVALRVSMVQPAAYQTLIFDNLRTLPPVDITALLTGMVDQYGQYTRQSWTGKVATDTDFGSQIANEQADIAANPRPATYDAYGGWAQGPQLQGTGYFRTAQAFGKWSLVSPSGSLFFSNGVDDIVFSNDETSVQSRQYMFNWLPAQSGDTFSQFYMNVANSGAQFAQPGLALDFLNANLFRKYATNDRTSLNNTALNRLTSWGFNSIGGSTDSSFANNGQMAYTTYIHVTGSYANVYAGAMSYAETPVPDPWDPAFAAAVANCARPLATKEKTDPWLIGYYVQDELGWNGPDPNLGRYGLAYGALSLAASASPAKRAFEAQLQAEYGTVGALNTAWGTTFSQWSDLDAPFNASTTPTSAQIADMTAFCQALANKYFSVVSSTLKTIDPNHLYLGCKFGNHWWTQEAMQAAAQYCDVISMNLYGATVDPNTWGFLSSYNKPFMVSEFSHGATDTGLFTGGFVTLPDQGARAQQYTAYVNSVTSNPAFVGCHFFRYLDDPCTGEPGDSESGNVGFVSITDTPYQTMVAAARAVNAQIYQRYAPLQFAPAAVTGSQTATATVSLLNPATSATTVALSSDNPAASVPASVVIASGQSSAAFNVITSPVASQTTANITASINGAVYYQAPITINPPAPSSVVINPASVPGGNSAAVVVNLNAAAAAPLTVALTSSNPTIVMVPASITVPAGSSSASFTAKTASPAMVTGAMIAAASSGVTASGPVTVTPNVPQSLTFTPSAVVGGTTAQGTVTLVAPASAPVVVSLSTSNASVAAPTAATITIPAGSATGTFTIATSATSVTTAANITADANGGALTMPIRVWAPWLSGMTLGPAQVLGGTPANGTVKLCGPAPAGGYIVSLVSSNPSAASVPATVTVPAGASSAAYTVTTKAQSSAVNVAVTASAAGKSFSSSITVGPASPASVAFNPNALFGGKTAQGTVTLNGPAAAATVVSLSSSNPAIAAPAVASITIPAGASTGTFNVTTNGVPTTTSVVITAQSAGGAATGTLRIWSPLLATISVNPSSVQGGASSTGTVTLNGPAPAGGIAVALSSSNTAVAHVPGSVTVPAGKSSVTFTVTTSAVHSLTNVTVSAAMGSSTVRTTLVVHP